jgi:hypothetical protein
VAKAVLDPQEAARQRRRKVIVSVIVVSIVVHFIGAILGGIWIVARYLLPTPATFEVKKEIRIAAEERQHRMNMDEFDALKPKPTFTDKMSTARPTEFALPDLPTLPVDALSAVDPSDIVSDQLASLTGSAGSGTGSGSGTGTKGSPVNFFGISDTATRVIITVDVSDSMFDRQPGKFDTVKEQAAKLVQGLSINTLFNIIVFEGGSVAMFPQLEPATDANKAKAQEWIKSVDGGKDKSKMSYHGAYKRMGTGMYEGGGTRLDTALKQALGMKPTSVFVISDGQIAKSPSRDAGGDGRGEQTEIEQEELIDLVKGLQAQLEVPARIHVVYFVTGRAKNEEEQRLRSLARRNDGRFKQVEAKDY